MACKPKNTEVAKAMIALVGTPYSRLDCQAAIEQAVKNCGGEMDYAGSNAMARDTLYLIPIEQAIGQGLQPGDALFIREADGGEPVKYKQDGLGNFNHVAMYVGENALTDTDKNGKVRACNAVHSSKSLGRVAGTTVKNGYTHAGRFEQIGYGEDGEDAQGEAGEGAQIGASPSPAQAHTDAPAPLPSFPAQSYVRVVTPDGNPVKIREKHDTSLYKYKAPAGTVMLKTGTRDKYFKVMYRGSERLVDQSFVVPCDSQGTTL